MPEYLEQNVQLFLCSPAFPVFPDLSDFPDLQYSLHPRSYPPCPLLQPAWFSEHQQQLADLSAKLELRERVLQGECEWSESHRMRVHMTHLYAADAERVARQTWCHDEEEMSQPT
jgi:hypothetical protein